MRKRSIGVCVGAATVSFVSAEDNDNKINIISAKSIRHNGNPGKIIKSYLCKTNIKGTYITATGKKFRDTINAASVPETIAVEEAIKFLGLAGKYDVVASLGAENFFVYCLDPKGEIINVYTGNKCASGTGEFFFQQAGRMNTGVERLAMLAQKNEPYPLSGRCSVFCKSDCTHALNKGVDKASVAAGLSKMIADKINTLLAKQKSSRIILTGGVTKNKGVLRFLLEKYPGIYVPKEAHYFEALGAGILAMREGVRVDKESLFKRVNQQFGFHPALSSWAEKVSFKSIKKARAKKGDICTIGLDVGSTTTKAVIIRQADNAMLASSYLRTNGNPVQASVECYKNLKKQTGKAGLKFIGLGVTGSGRHIAGLHGLTRAIVNEIIAHAKAAKYFDNEVDTIFEIGGQDAKYTHLTAGIAGDYAMNEACSAGTGSFLEEAAKETLGIDYRDIAGLAMRAKKPPNFSDQCAAFISSDIKNAAQAGISTVDITAGLVYSICMNYINRVKGARPAGKKIFMQGGVCYNKAVPVAMSGLLGSEIIVPPEPGLMGAFGAALEAGERIKNGLMPAGDFSLEKLISRRFKKESEFICPGGTEKCDRKCGISIINIDGMKYPFGGACSKYYNQRMNIHSDPGKKNYVKIRQKLVFGKYVSMPNGTGKTIGINKSLLSHTFFPLYYNFFAKLGFRVILPDAIKKDGTESMQSSFCFPVEAAHGFFTDLVTKNPDYIFLPHITEMHGKKEQKYKRACVFAQGESYILKSAFSGNKMPEILSPVIDFSGEEAEVEEAFIGTADKLGKSREEGRDAYRLANGLYTEMLREFKEIGAQAIMEIEKDKNKSAIVLFGRTYNAFPEEINLSIPEKIASKGVTVIPFDFLPDTETYETHEHMYWHSGQHILQNARLVKKHTQLFGAFITNFSCGPDSFIVPYFRKVMGEKPSLTLELDSHSADVGIETRVEAALDIIANYRQIHTGGENDKGKVKEGSFAPMEVKMGKDGLYITDSSGMEHMLKSKEVELLIPSMGSFGTSGLAASFRAIGINAIPMPVPTEKTLKYGRAHSTGKECLPFILTAGSMIEHIMEGRASGKKTLFFMPKSTGPCRQGQYFVAISDLIAGLGVKDAGVMTLNDENSYRGLGKKYFVMTWAGIVLSDIFQDIENALLALAKDRDSAVAALWDEWGKVLKTIEAGKFSKVMRQAGESAKTLSKIELKHGLKDAKTISIVGEIYIRKEEFSKLGLIKALADNGFVVRTAPVAEYILYCNYLSKNKLRKERFAQTMKAVFTDKIERWMEARLRDIMSKSGLVLNNNIEVGKTIGHASHLISKKLLGEGILTTGLALREILDESCGVITIGPFNCMPGRLSEAILSREMTLAGKIKSGENADDRNGWHRFEGDVKHLPYLHIETDGNPYPPLIQSRLEIFMTQAERLHEKLKIGSSDEQKHGLD